MDDKRGFGLRIKAAREKGKHTLDSAAELCDVSLSTWKQYERGERLPSLPKFITICTGLKVTPEHLLGPELEDLQNRMNEVEQLKAKIGRLDSDDITVIDLAISKHLQLKYGE